MAILIGGLQGSDLDTLTTEYLTQVRLATSPLWE